MENEDLSKLLTSFSVEQKYLQKQIKILARKKVRKTDPYDVMHCFLTHFFCTGNDEKFNELFHSHPIKQ